MPTPTPQKDEQTPLYEAAEAERDKHTNAVLTCDSPKVVVVAGPGTGKTFLFQMLLEKRGKKSLVLSFVNALVDDLAMGLSGMSEVRTLHGYVASHLWNARQARMYPDLPLVIGQDAEVLLKRKIDFNSAFQNPDGKDEEIKFYKGRKEYYGKYYGYTDAAYAVVKDLEAKKQVGRLPKYDQILVDEFQDFNDIEVALIDLLADASPVLIAGDDGQSLYGQLKGSHPKHLRARHSAERPEYVPFNLPFCSRCPRVVVEAVNDITRQAKAAGLLVENIEKPYDYFKCKEKDKVSDANPRISYFQRASNGVVSLITKLLTEISKQERKEFSVLIIVPPRLKNLIKKLAKPLRSDGFRKLTLPKPKTEEEDRASLLDGLKLLLEDKDSNLGYRVAARRLLSASDFESLLIASSKDGATHIRDLLDTSVRAKIKAMRATLNCINEGKEVETERLTAFLKEVGYEPVTVATETLQEDLDAAASAKQSSQRNIRDLPITITTIPGSKGLAADYVFLAYFNSDCFGDPKPTDEDVFNFVVAVTRAKKGLSIISTTKQVPLFVDWIDTQRVTRDLMPDYDSMPSKKAPARAEST